MPDVIGTVISTGSSPSTSKFSFVINAKRIRKGQFVCCDSPEGRTVARIADIIKTNHYFERAESVQEFERSGKSLAELFPAARWEYLVADAVALGVCSNGQLLRSAYPPSPGTKVRLVDSKTLADFFGLDLAKGLHLGKIEHHDVDVKLSLTRLLHKHLAILGISGSGKSYCVADLIEELLDRPPEHGQLAIIVIDTHGEYIGFAEDPAYRQKADVVLGRNFRIGVPGLSASMIAEFIPALTAVQRRELNKLLAKLNEEKRGKVFDLRDVLTKLESDEIIKKSDTRGILYTYLYDLANTRLFGGYDDPALEKLAAPQHLTIVDISDITNLREKQIIVAYLARKLFEARRAKAIPPFVLIIEEAHNFAPEGVHREGAISKRIIERLAREGRKFHTCLCLVSQRPIQLSTTALSQCNTHIIMRVTNPYDLDHIGRSSEGLTADVLKTISSLRTGDALIVGEAVNVPLFMRVRKRRSMASERGIPLEAACLEFASDMTKRSADAAAFV
jgi:hypothetical protein